jgi:hypothetical protein
MNGNDDDDDIEFSDQAAQNPKKRGRKKDFTAKVYVHGDDFDDCLVTVLREHEGALNLVKTNRVLATSQNFKCKNHKDACPFECCFRITKDDNYDANLMQMGDGVHGVCVCVWSELEQHSASCNFDLQASAAASKDWVIQILLVHSNMTTVGQVQKYCREQLGSKGKGRPHQVPDGCDKEPSLSVIKTAVKNASLRRNLVAVAAEIQGPDQLAAFADLHSRENAGDDLDQFTWLTRFLVSSGLILRIECSLRLSDYSV